MLAPPRHQPRAGEGAVGMKLGQPPVLIVLEAVGPKGRDAVPLAISAPPYLIVAVIDCFNHAPAQLFVTLVIRFTAS
jgi:hypothetical protein